MDLMQIAHILDNNAIAMLTLDANQNVVRTNDSAIKVLHHCADELRGGYLPDLMPHIYDSGTLRCGHIRYPVNRHVFVASFPLHGESHEGQTLVTLQDLTKQVMHDIYTRIFNLLSESIVICDTGATVIGVNDANSKIEGMMPETTLGKHVTEVYQLLDKSNFTILDTLTTMKPLLNNRQIYVTQHGRVVDGLGNTYPIFLDDQLFGAVAIMEDYSRIDELTRKIVELEAKLSVPVGKKTMQKKYPTARYHFNNIIYSNPDMVRLIRKCKLVAKSDSSVMIYGETGTGKELIAQSIHNDSSRANKPFIAVNCAAIPENLLESVLFGTVKGAFTGSENQIGLFEQAHTGTLLLDELNSMSLSLQSKLLRVLEEGSVRRLGSIKDIPVDVRIISNINMPPNEATDKGILRKDLFYRLGVVNLTIPPLRERKEDIMLLSKNFMMKCNSKLLKNVTSLSQDVEDIFLRYSWPGNVRELEHAIEHAMNIMPGYSTLLNSQMLPDYIVEATQTTQATQNEDIDVASSGSLSHMLEQVEYRILTAAMERHNGNITHAAQALQTSRQQLKYRLDKYGIKAGHQ